MYRNADLEPKDGFSVLSWAYNIVLKFHIKAGMKNVILLSGFRNKEWQELDTCVLYEERNEMVEAYLTWM